MAHKRPGLGKGLDALIPQGDSFLRAQPESGYTEISVELIHPNPRQPRSSFNQEGIIELAASIMEHGIIQPLIVSVGPSEGEYQLIAGERRLLAAKEAGLKTVPAVIREITDQGLIEIALIENVQRTDLNPLEKAEAYRQLTEEFNLSHEEVGHRVGKSRASITNTLRLLSLPPNIQQALIDELISEGHARALLSLPTSQSQSAALQTVLEKDLTVRQTETFVKKLAGIRPELVKKPGISPELEALEERLRLRLGTRVTLKPGRVGGSITIHYFSDEELNALLDIILSDD